MAELSQQERPQPSLLDRLLDDEGDGESESRDRRVFSPRRFREAVLRDLSWLFNASNMGEELDERAYPNVARSVLNYGMPPFAGRFSAASDLSRLEEIVTDVVRTFEPRIIADTLRVKLVRREDGHAGNAMAIDIEGELWAQPVPLRVYLRTELDLEVGSVRVTDTQGFQ